jgi:hypothetical protein
MTVDTSLVYRLRNAHLGPGRSLDAGPRLAMAPSGDGISQRWRLVPRPDGTVALRSSSHGDCYALDVRNDGHHTPFMAPAGDFSGQLWTVRSGPDGTVRLLNRFAGPQLSFGVHRTTGEPGFSAGDGAAQRWTLTALGDAADEVPEPGRIPHLHQGGVSHLSEGPGDHPPCLVPAGRLTGVMIFVDFPDVPAGGTSAALTGEHLLGAGRAQQLLRDQSYGRLELDVTVRADLGWREMPEPAAAYGFAEFHRQRAFVSAAAGMFAPAEIRFSDYDIVYVVAAETAHFPLSPAFLPGPDDSAPSLSGPIRHAVTFGADSYRNRYTNLVHETGHLLGLPDLYRIGGGAGDHLAGCWDLMSDIFHSVSFLGWHRHKNDWLPAARKTYVADRRRGWRTTLHPLTGPAGLSMVVLPADDVRCPAKVFVVELAQPVLGSDGESSGDGVLVYTVDASIESGACPVVVIPRRESSSDTFGDLYEAPYGVGDVAQAGERTGGRLTVDVMARHGPAYEVELTYQPPQ